MVYIPHTDAERQKMLQTLGLTHIEELFQDVPAQFRFPNLGLPDAVSEMEVMQELLYVSEINLNANNVPAFLGAGAYRHWIPSAVEHLLSRGEFVTAYTPYQPEISQGTLQAIFEYQSLICDLTRMDVANASHYDGATAAAEAVIQAYNVFRKKRNKVVLSPTLHPHYREVIRTYTQGMGLELVGDDDLDLPTAKLLEQVDGNTVCLVLQTPNFLGQLEDLKGLADAVHNHGNGALLAVGVNPISLGLLAPPGDYGADIVFGEGQPLGLGLNFGGPYLGFYATRGEYTRQMAGRLVGQTADKEGKRGFVMTLTTREQHIRREKATSNICTNQGLLALSAAVYLSALGKNGLRQVAELNYHKAHYLADAIDQIEGFSVVRERPFFNEFVVHCPGFVFEINEFLAEGLESPIIGGYDMGQDFLGYDDCMLVAVTEMNTRNEMALFVEGLRLYAEMPEEHHHDEE